MKYKMAIVVRSDLGMSKGKLAVQVAHAAVSCALSANSSRDHIYALRSWFEEGQRKVCLKVETLDELLALESLAMVMRIPFQKITDFGLTELPPNTITCLGIGPGLEEDVNKITGSLKLV